MVVGTITNVLLMVGARQTACWWVLQGREGGRQHNPVWSHVVSKQGVMQHNKPSQSMPADDFLQAISMTWQAKASPLQLILSQSYSETSFQSSMILPCKEMSRSV